MTDTVETQPAEEIITEITAADIVALIEALPDRTDPTFAESLSRIQALSTGLDASGRSLVLDAFAARIPASARGAEISLHLEPMGLLLVDADDLELDRIATQLNGRLGQGAPKKVVASALRQVRTAARKAARTTAEMEAETDFELGDCVELAKRLITNLGSRDVAVFDEGSIHCFDDQSGVWVSRKLHDLHSQIGEFSGKSLPKGRLKLSREGIKGVRAQAEDMLAEPGFFQRCTPGFAFRNGFVTIKSNGEIELVPHDREHRATYGYDFDWDPERESDALVDFYAEIFSGDSEAAIKTQFLLEFYGASLIGEAWRAGKAVIKVGGGNDGKSVETEIMSSVFPSGSVGAVTPHDWSNDQKLANLAPLRLNYAGELSSKELKETNITKAVITGNDRVTAKVVYRPPFDFYARCGHVMASNLPLPNVSDNSRGFWRRWVLIEFTRSFLPEEENKLIVEHVTKDRQAIVCALIHGAAQFVGNGYKYTEIPASSERIQAEWQSGAEPVRRWVGDACTVDPTGSTEAELWCSFKIWSEQNRHMMMSSATFKGRLCSIMRDLAARQWANELRSIRHQVARAGFYISGGERRYPVKLNINVTNESEYFDNV